jgi:glycosyltransferase involved in cell wall biosynthesis
MRLSPAARERVRFLLLGGVFGGATTIGGVDAFRAGFVDEIHDAMAGLDLLLHPSSAEGLGTAVIDAMALRVPPVAFAVGGLPELIEDGACGLLAPPQDLVAFAAAASRAIEDGALRERLAAAGPARAEHFGVDRMVEGTRAAYQRVLDARPAGG